MWRRFPSIENILFAATWLLATLLLVQFLFLELGPDEKRAVFGLTGIGGIGVAVANRARKHWGESRVAPFSLAFITLITSSIYSILYHAAHEFWTIYLLIPLAFASLYSARWAYLADTFSVLAMLGVAMLNGFWRNPLQDILDVSVLATFSLIAVWRGRLGVVHLDCRFSRHRDCERAFAQRIANARAPARALERVCDRDESRTRSHHAFR